MKTKIFFGLFIYCGVLMAQQVQYVNFKDYFENKTMRVDYFHSGTANEEHFSVDRILNDGYWSGSKNKLIDELKFGLYFYEVEDENTGQILYSRGFGSIFGEWQTIPEATKKWGTFHESVRFPWPLKPVILKMYKRNTANQFDLLWEEKIDPYSRAVNPAANNTGLNVYTILDNGSPSEKVDIVLLGDGYTENEMEKFRQDAHRLSNELFAVQPYKSNKTSFNVRAVETPSEISGVNRPHPQVFKRTPLSISYSSFDSERYALSYDNRTIRDVAATVPYDFMVILINEKTYGGGGIYHLYATVAVDNKFSDYIFVHEFGHHFAALADEYYTSSVSYEMGEITVEPWEANITALINPKELKWKHQVDKSTPLPTPWDKEKYDAFSYEIQAARKDLRAKKVPESEVEALFEREKRESTSILDNMEYSGKVGAFEGGGYMQFGLYRPFADCIMFTRNKQMFCPVCRDALSEVIQQYTK
ncbi:MAG: IgA Peptidase M64 [Bacteroidales bacterium]|nr:IgA Peptidase M64 [Bacteroidales bacterium]MCF8405138.1 IgA Peptidase M64 [Bacteroidales bacterium]